MTTALIDGDLLVFQVCAAAEYGREPEEVDYEDVQRAIESKVWNVRKEAGCDDYRLFFTDGNYRHFITGDYKANRAGVWRPECLSSAVTFCKLFLKGESQKGLEADDLLAINQTEATVICTLDKDLLQVDGRHYRWPHASKDGYITDVVDGWRNLYYQGLIGDSTDGIIGCGKRTTAVYKSGAKKGQEYTRRVGVTPKPAKALIDSCDTEEQAIKAVKSEYRKVFEDCRWCAKFFQQMRLVHMVREFDGTYAKLYGGDWMNPATGEWRMDG